MDQEKLIKEFQEYYVLEITRIDQVSMFSLKTLFALNGSALIALFAFLSSLLDTILKEKNNKIVQPMLLQTQELSIIWLSGLGLALLATLLMYFTHRFNIKILQKQFSDVGLEIEGTPKTNCYSYLHAVFTFFGIIFGVFSAIFFLFGIYELSNSIDALKNIVK